MKTTDWTKTGKLLTVIFGILILSTSFFASENTATADVKVKTVITKKSNILSPKINEVIIFQDLAQIKSRVISYLQEGEQTLVISPKTKDPEHIHLSSIQISGPDSIMIKGIRYKMVSDNKKYAKEIKGLKSKRENLRNEVLQVEDFLSQNNESKLFVNRIIKKIVQSKNKDSKSELNPDNWIKMYNFHKEKLSGLNNSNSHFKY